MLIQISPLIIERASHWRLLLQLHDEICRWDSLTGRWRSSRQLLKPGLNARSSYKPIFWFPPPRKGVSKAKIFQTNLSVFINFNLQMIKKWLRFLTCNDKCWELSNGGPAGLQKQILHWFGIQTLDRQLSGPVLRRTSGVRRVMGVRSQKVVPKWVLIED